MQYMLIYGWYSCICYLCIKIYKATGNSNHTILPHKTTMALSKDLREGTINSKQSSGTQCQRSKIHAVTRKWHEAWNESRWKGRKEQGRGEQCRVVEEKTLLPAPPHLTHTQIFRLRMRMDVIFPITHIIIPFYSLATKLHSMCQG